MVGSSKILTVSYGTFSCTLEGFDDSFDTMKAIAEYFRDLAADDRYFGAEPPTPDADMLARIAEREISRRVEAHEERGKIVLRADTARSMLGSGAGAAADDLAPEDLAAPETGDVTRHAGDDTSGDVPQAETESGLADREDGASEDTAAEASPSAAPEMTEADAPEPEALWPEPVALANSDPLEDAAEAAARGDEEKDVENEEPGLPDAGATDADADQKADQEPDQEMVEAAEQTDPEVDVMPAPAVAAVGAGVSGVIGDSLSDKLARIRAAVGNTQTDDQTEDLEVSEAQDFIDPPARSEDVGAEDEMTETRDSAPDRATEPETARAPETQDVAEADAPDPLEDTLAALMADAAPITEEATQAEPAPQAARVVKVKRAAFDKALDDGLFEEEEEATAGSADENFFAGADVTLSPEEEADLQRELAEVEAELAQEDTQSADPETPAQPDVLDTSDDLPETSGAAAPPASPRDAPAHALDRASGPDDLSRMFDETDSHLEAPSNSQRRNAIQHLRAAVAATRAEQKAGSSLEKKVDETPYRNDLQDVVRPRRPQMIADASRSARPEEPRPAPLKLVAEQRVDMPRPKIRPRRISAAPVAEGTVMHGDDEGFSDFADRMGAHTLTERLEAAAAYMADYEGRDQFSRPMLMTKLKEVEQAQFSREDGLRCFGQLLRSGKLQKLAGGRFAVTEETDFRADDRRQAG